MKKLLENSKYPIFVLGVFVFAGFLTSAKPANENLPENAAIVDVRTPAEFHISHYPGAKNIPLSDIEARILDFGAKEQPIIVYCRSGRRSGIAKKFLENAGYTQVKNGGALDRMLRLQPMQDK